MFAGLRCSGPGDGGDATIDAVDTVDAAETSDAFDGTGEPPIPEIVEGSKLGDRISDLPLVTCDGRATSLLELANASGAYGALWLTLHAGWCTSCLSQHDALHAFHDSYAPRGLRFVFVLGEGGVPGVEVGVDYCQGFAASSDFDFPVVRDEGFEATTAWDTGAWPVQVLVDREGIIRAVQRGWDPQFHETWFAERLEELLEQL